MSLFSQLSKVFLGPRKFSTKEKITPSIKPPTPPKPTSPRLNKWGQLQSRPLAKTPPTPSPIPDQTIREAQAKSREIILEAKDQALRIREEAETAARVWEQKVQKLASDHATKVHEIDRKAAVLQEKESLREASNPKE